MKLPSNPSINAQDFGRRNANSYTYWIKLHRYLSSNIFRKKLLRKCLAYDMYWFGCGQNGFGIWKTIFHRQFLSYFISPKQDRPKQLLIFEGGGFAASEINSHTINPQKGYFSIFHLWWKLKIFAEYRYDNFDWLCTCDFVRHNLNETQTSI